MCVRKKQIVKLQFSTIKINCRKEIIKVDQANGCQAVEKNKSVTCLITATITTAISVV